MKQAAKTLQDFWSAFGLPAFVEGYVPDDQALPYITYQLLKPYWKQQVSTYARVWYYDRSYVDITEKVNQIETVIGEGITLKSGDGFIFLAKDVNFCQFQPTDTEGLKVAYLQLILEANKT